MGFWDFLKRRGVSPRWSIRPQATYNFPLMRGDGEKYINGLTNYRASSSMHLLYSELTRKAREIYHDSLPAHSLITQLTNFGVGSGLVLEASPVSDILGISEDKLAAWSIDVQRRFHMWAKSKESHIERRSTFYQLQRTLFLAQQRDGEYFARLHYLPERIAIGTFDPGQVIPGTDASGREFTQGVHRDQYGATDAYNIRIPNGNTVQIPAFTDAGAPLIIHGYLSEYSGQLRGLSQIAHILQECKNLATYEINELVKAGLHSSLNLFVKPSKDAPASNVFEDMAFGAGPLGSEATVAPLVAPDGSTVDPVSYQPLTEAPALGGGVSVFTLNAGEDLKAFEPTSPNLNYASYVKAVSDHIYAAASVPPEIASLSFNSNYSASQAAMLMFWIIAQIWRDELVSDLLSPIYEVWLEREIATGRIQAPGWSDPYLRSAWANSQWIGVGKPELDPLKRAAASKLWVELGLTTLDRTAKELNGSNAALNRSKLIAELATLPPVPWSSNGRDTQNRG